MDEYFGLVFRAIKTDKNVPRVIAFIKRLLQMCYVNEGNFTAATLLVISEIWRCRKDVTYEIFQFDVNRRSKEESKEPTQIISSDAIGISGAKDDSDDEEEVF